MYDRYITIYMPPGMDIWKQELSMLPYPYPELAKRTYITSSYDEFDNITKYHVLEEESFFFLFNSDQEKKTFTAKFNTNNSV